MKKQRRCPWNRWRERFARGAALSGDEVSVSIGENSLDQFPAIRLARDKHSSLAATKFTTPTTISPMHYDAHQPIITDLEARILTIRDSL